MAKNKFIICSILSFILVACSIPNPIKKKEIKVWQEEINGIAYYIDNKILIEIKKRYFRPAEVDNLKGNSSKAKKILKWKPKINLNQGITKTVNWYLENQKYFSNISRKLFIRRLGKG